MKKITYFNKEIKEDIDITKKITEDSYEIKELNIEIQDEELDYHLNIINTSYSQFGKVTVEEGEPIQPSESDRIKDLEMALAELIGGANYGKI